MVNILIVYQPAPHLQQAFFYVIIRLDSEVAMKRLFNKRTLLIIAGIVVVVGLLTATFSYSLRHKSNLNYEDEVKLH